MWCKQGVCETGEWVKVIAAKERLPAVVLWPPHRKRVMLLPPPHTNINKQTNKCQGGRLGGTCLV